MLPPNFPPLEDIFRLASELVLCVFGILIMLVDPFIPRAYRGPTRTVALLGAGLALAATRLAALHQGVAFYGLLRIDSFSIFLHVVIGAVAALVILGSSDYLAR